MLKQRTQGPSLGIINPGLIFIKNKSDRDVEVNTRAGALIVSQVIDVLSRKPGILLSLSLSLSLACLKTRQCGLYGQNAGRLRDGAVTRGPDPGAHTKNAARLRDGG